MPLSSGALVETWGEQGMMAVIHGTERWRGSGCEVLRGSEQKRAPPACSGGGSQEVGRGMGIRGWTGAGPHCPGQRRQQGHSKTTPLWSLCSSGREWLQARLQHSVGGGRMGQGT